MALQDIIQKISDEANKKAALMKQTVDDEVKKIREESQIKADARKTEIEQKIEAQSASVSEKSKTLALMAGRSTTLKEKREVIDVAYEQVKKSLDDLSDHDYLKLVTDMIKHAISTTEKGSLIVPANRQKITQEAIEKAGADYHIKSETNDFKGGFILMSGKVEMNMSFSYLIQKIVRPSTEIEVAKILFP